MNLYNKRTITVEEIQSSPIDISVIHYEANRTVTIDLPENFDDNILQNNSNQIKSISDLIVIVLSNVAKRLHKFQSGDEGMKYFVETGWKTTIISNSGGVAFIFPEKFTQEFIDSKQGKRFKDKKPCAHMFMRALQSQKTIMEQLVVE